MSIGKRKEDRRSRPPRWQFSNLILDAGTQSKLTDAVSWFQNRDLLLRAWGLQSRHSDRGGLTVNLYGPPGTGKTMAAHALAHAIGKDILPADYASLESKYAGETAKNLTSLFQAAQQEDAVLFLDEADCLLSRRAAAPSTAADVSVNQTRSVLLTLLDAHLCPVVFATNSFQVYDPAFLRRIRFHIPFPLPDRETRNRLWNHFIPKEMPCQADAEALADAYDGISGSDIAEAVFSAAVRVVSHRETFVTHSRLAEAIEEIIRSKSDHHGGEEVQPCSL